jgi:hypothetical protein
MIFNRLTRPSITLLDEKWNLVEDKVKVDFIPRIHELIFIPKENKYYRVVNVVYTLSKTPKTFVIIEKYTDDFKLIEKNNKKT